MCNCYGFHEKAADAFLLEDKQGTSRNLSFSVPGKYAVLYLTEHDDYLNRYDVIYLDITGFISRAFVKDELWNVVVNIQDEVVSELAAAYPQAEKKDNLPDMLYQISRSTGQKFIFIIDEWDALFREAKDDTFLLDSYIQLLGGESIPVETETFQNDMANIKRKDDVLTLLAHLGYLAYDAEKKKMFISNEEVRQEFIRAVTVGKH